MAPEIPKELLKRIKQIAAKRPRTVLDHIVKYGFITTEELKEKYGYNHPPRAARDVREHGIALETYKVADTKGRVIAAYRLNLKSALESSKTGRKLIPKEIKKTLIEKFGAHCALCGGLFDSTFLQVDHKVPYEVAGESEAENPDAFMLVCGSCNRTKSWACEHCLNWQKNKIIPVCKSCYWANPTEHTHVATVDVRRADIVWLDKREVAIYDRFRESNKKSGETLQAAIKRALARSLE